MWEPEIEWSDTKRIKNAMIAELSGNVLKIDFNVYLCSKEKIVFWRVIRMIYQLFRDQLGEKCDHKHLFVEYNGGAAPYEIVCYIQGVAPTLLWAKDDPTDKIIKENYQNWIPVSTFFHQIREYYEECKIIQKQDRKKKKLAQLGMTEEDLKELNHQKWLQNDPNSPAARNQRARRHLMRLGYTLHKSNKIRYFTADDRGQYKIVDANGKTVLGATFDATIDDVERFYTAQDKKRWSGRYCNKVHEKEQQPQRDLKREHKAAARLKKYGFELEYNQYYNPPYEITDSLGYQIEYRKSLEEVEEICQKLRNKGLKERESPVKQRKILQEFKEKIEKNHDIWVEIGFDWKSTERNKGYMIVDGNKTLLGENYSLTLNDIATYIKNEGREDWQKENTVRYQLRKHGYLLRKKRVRDWKNYDPHEFLIVDAATKKIIAGADTMLTLEEVERWILHDNCLEKST